jgi:hypothetical protein
MFLVQIFFDPNSYQKKKGGTMNASLITGIIIGLLIGTNVGVLVAGLLASAKRGDNNQEEEEAQWQSINSQG